MVRPTLEEVDLFQDLRYALRQFRRSPTFFAIAALLIALGIAANTQIFSLVNAVLLRPLLVRDPQSLIQILEIRPRLPIYPYFDYPFYKQLASRSTTLYEVAGQIEQIVSLERGATAERSHIHCVSLDYFSNLGVQPILGRSLSTGDDHVAVLSYQYWTRSFGRDPNAVGQTLRLKGHVYRIVGVAPEQFTGTIIDSGPDLWIPHSNILDFSTHPDPTFKNYVIEIVARVRPGVSREQAEQETSALWTRYMSDDALQRPENYKGRKTGSLEVRSIAHGLSPIRDQSATALVVLLCGAGLLLLMVCASVGGLLLARATAREKETAVRLAVGAGRWRIVRQWLTESLLLCLVSGGAGILFARWSMPLFARLLPPARGIGFDPSELRTLSLNLHLDLRVLVFSIAACVLTAMLSAFAPAWRSSRHDLSTTLKTTVGEASHQRFQMLLCAAQVALCTVLLVSAGLMTRSLSNLRARNMGFDRDHVVVLSVDPHLRGYDSHRTFALQRRLIDGARAIPSVEGAAIASRPLMRGIGLGNSVVLAGQRGDGLFNSSVNEVSPEYFGVMGIHLLAGRAFSPAENKPNQLTPVIVNQTFATRFFQGQNPLGRQFATGKEFTKPQYEVIGVVSDTSYRSLREIPPPIFYQDPFGPDNYPDTFSLHFRTHGDPRSAIQPLRDLLHSIDPEVPFFQLATLSEEVERSLWQERFLVALSSSFGIFALTLSAIGLYGILAFFVTGRRREIGLRLALGADPGHVIRLVAGRVAPLLALGVLTGAGLAMLVGRWVGSLLYGVEPFDPWAASASLLLLVAIGIAAAAVPIIRAMRVDPAATLRTD